MIPRLYLIFLLLFAITWSLSGQARPAPEGDSIRSAADALLRSPAESGINSFLVNADTINPDTVRVRMSKDSLDADVEYSAVDSMVSDFTSEKIYLYGQAEVKYTTITLKAGFIVLDYSTKIVTAEGRRDSIGQFVELPEFTDGSQTFTAERMRYNFETKKGIVYDVSSSYNDVVVQGQRTKFVSGKEIPPASPEDTIRKTDDILYSRNAIFTTCAHPDPHFGIRSKKQKVIPDKLVVVGPSNLEIMGIPTPLWLPFGFFPIAKGRRSGLIFPRDYEYSPQWGFGVRDLGWFFPLGEHFNLSLTTNLYFKGTWGLNAYSQYRKRYKYSGSLRLGFDSRRSEDNEGRINKTNSFNIAWSHNQDRSAHPTVTFGGSINLQLGDFNRTVYNDPGSVLAGQLNSNFRFEKRWTDKPFNFGASFNHSQNTNTRQMTINFPTLNFQTQALYPFKRKGGGGQQRWYETITMRYRGEAKNRFMAADTSLFSQQTLEDAQFGVQHNISSGMSFKLFRYFNLNPSFNYEEVWYSKSRNIDFVDSLDFVVDTIYNADSSSYQLDTIILSQGYLDTMNLYGFKTFRQYNAGLTLNTQIFGTLRFSKGWLRGLRHVVKPSVSFVFAPDYLAPKLGYFDYVPIDPDDPDELRRYSVFEGAIFGGPPASGRQMALSYSLNNIFEAKIFSRKDSTEKKVKLMDNIIISGSYNFAADSLQWSPVNMGGTTRFFKGATTFRFGAQFDPYVTDENGRRINRTSWKETGAIVRFVNANAALNTNLTISKIRALFQGKEEEVVEDVREERERRQEERRQGRTEETGDGLLDLLENFSIQHNLSVRWNNDDPRRKPFEVTVNTVNIVGRIKLSKYWNINIGSFGYDFVRKNLTYPYLGFSRDLHCWELGFNTAPNRGTYSFYIRVKPGSLDFLKIPYDQNNADAIRGF